MSYLINYDYQNIIIITIFIQGSGQYLALPNRLESNFFSISLSLIFHLYIHIIFNIIFFSF